MILLPYPAIPQEDRKPHYMPCKAAVVIEGNEIYIPISQAQDLCREIGEPSEISKVYLKINGKITWRTQRKYFQEFSIIYSKNSPSYAMNRDFAFKL